TQRAIKRAIAARPSLGADQREVVETITRSGNALDVVIGPAGTGKTFLLDAARDAWESRTPCIETARPAVSWEHPPLSASEG
ncbi:MAG: AAA family ATPase, partial [Acidimicrobiales bacterium]